MDPFTLIAFAIAAGLLQGVAEWLPISSKTLVLLVMLAAGLSADESYSIGLLLNGSTAVAAAYYFRKEIMEMLKAVSHISQSSPPASYLRFLVVSTLVTGLVGVPLAALGAEGLSRMGGLSAMLVVGMLLVGTGYLSSRGERMLAQGLGSRVSPDAKSAVLAGIAQGFAALPGISRSGVTMALLLSMGYRADAALTLSFLMSIPASVGGSGYVLAAGRGMGGLTKLGLMPSLLMVSASILVGLGVIGYLLRLATRVKLSSFTYAMAFSTILAALILMLL